MYIRYENDERESYHFEPFQRNITIILIIISPSAQTTFYSYFLSYPNSPLQSPLSPSLLVDPFPLPILKITKKKKANKLIVSPHSDQNILGLYHTSKLGT